MTAAHGENVGTWIRRRVLVADDLLVEHLLVRHRQALAAVGPRKTDSRQSPIEEQPLQFALVRDIGQLGLLVVAAVVQAQLLHGHGPQVGTDEGTGPAAEALEVLQLVRVSILFGP